MTPSYAREILAMINYPAYTFEIIERNGEMFLRALYVEDDVVTGEPKVQPTKKWFISKHAIKSEVVQTAFKCILTSAEHRVREHFKYLNEAVYSPHYDVDQLYALRKKKASESRREGGPTPAPIILP